MLWKEVLRIPTTEKPFSVYITMLIATSPWCSPDQEKNKSTEEAHSDQAAQKSSKINSVISTNKGEDTCKNHTVDEITPQSVINFVADCTGKEQPKELYDNQQTIKAQSIFCSHTNMSTTILPNVQHHTKETLKTKGEECMCYIQPKQVPSEEHHNSLETFGQKDECCDSLQNELESENFTSKVPVQPEQQVQNSMKIPTVQLKPGNLQPTPSTQSVQNPNQLQSAPLRPNKLCKLDKSSQFLRTATMQSDSQLNPTQMSDELSERLQDFSQSGGVHFVRSCNSLRTVPDQTEDLNIPLHKPPILSEKCCDFANSASLDLSKTKEIETFQKENFNLPAFSKWDDLYNAGQRGSNLSVLLHQSSQEATGLEDCLHTTETAQDQEDSIGHCGQQISTNFADFNYTKRISALQSDEMCLSSATDSRWSDSVNANKVAVKGDLNG